MTMDYLVTMVMDAAEEGKWADWYDFVWNRTRAIRKVKLRDLTDTVQTSSIGYCAHLSLLLKNLVHFFP